VNVTIRVELLEALEALAELTLLGAFDDSGAFSGEAAESTTDCDVTAAGAVVDEVHVDIGLLVVGVTRGTGAVANGVSIDATTPDDMDTVVDGVSFEARDVLAILELVTLCEMPLVDSFRTRFCCQMTSAGRANAEATKQPQTTTLSSMLPVKKSVVANAESTTDA
jgi:hypothetical protein